jgi:hypothetical protein
VKPRHPPLAITTLETIRVPAAQEGFAIRLRARDLQREETAFHGSDVAAQLDQHIGDLVHSAPALPQFCKRLLDEARSASVSAAVAVGGVFAIGAPQGRLVAPVYAPAIPVERVPD